MEKFHANMLHWDMSVHEVILYCSKLPYKLGEDLLDIQYMATTKGVFRIQVWGWGEGYKFSSFFPNFNQLTHKNLISGEAYLAPPP